MRKMSEKRFELDRIGIFDNETNHFYYKTFDNEEVVALLNQLSDENEQLRQTNNEQKEAIDYLKTVIRYTIPNQMVADVFKKIGAEYE